jgi:hypothetical protein
VYDVLLTGAHGLIIVQPDAETKRMFTQTLVGSLNNP